MVTITLVGVDRGPSNLLYTSMFSVPMDLRIYIFEYDVCGSVLATRTAIHFTSSIYRLAGRQRFRRGCWLDF